MNPIPAMTQLKHNFNSLMIRFNFVSGTRAAKPVSIEYKPHDETEDNAARDWARELAKICKSQHTCPKG